MTAVLEVSALNRYVRSLFEGDPFLSDIKVRGEICNFSRNYKTGHCYFSLIDSKSSVKAVMFRLEVERLSFQPQNGMTVLARGRVSLYERDGAYQIYVDALFPEGEGENKTSLDLLKEKLFREGLFDAEKKKPIPALSWTIGVITSKTGAALQDILHVAQRRNPCVRIILAHVRVQGAQAAAEIIHAVQEMDRCRVNVILIARGGGSSEDLSVFNNESLSKAVFNAKTPVISAVGHEIDFTVLDFVADMRAPTPSAAAELAVADLREILKNREILCMNKGKNIHSQLHLCYNELYSQQKSSVLKQSARQIVVEKEQLSRLSRALQEKVKHKMTAVQADLREAMQLADSLSPYGVLSRGYAVVKKQGTSVNRVTGLSCGDSIQVIFCDGEATADVVEVQSHKE